MNRQTTPPLFGAIWRALLLAVFSLLLGACSGGDGGAISSSTSSTPTAISKVAMGEDHSCALLNDGSVRCWGSSEHGRLGVGMDSHDEIGDLPGEMGNALKPLDLGTGRTALQLVTGQYFACALLDDHSVKCWGRALLGVLGNGNTETFVGDDPWETGDALPAVDLGSGRSAKALAAGTAHVCAILDNGQVKCWGANSYGQLGLGDTNYRGDQPGEMGDSLPTVDLGTGVGNGFIYNHTAKAIAAGDNHTCVILDDSGVKCWGINSHGMLGLGDVTHRGDHPGEMGDALPGVALGTGRTAKGITAGSEHTCALLDDDSVKCWGANNNGQLGQGDTAARGDGPGEMGDNLLKVDLGDIFIMGAPFITTAKSVRAGSGHTCAVLTDGSVKCWGRNDMGQLGLGDTDARGDGAGEMGIVLPTVNLGNGRTALQVSGGQGLTCAVLDNMSVKCWGKNLSGELGLGDTVHRGDNPGEMGDNLPAIDLGNGFSASQVASHTNTCVISSTGQVKCWGYNYYGGLGNGTAYRPGDEPGEMARLIPVDLGSGRSARDIAVSSTHSCALLDNGKVKCWGYNSGGELGIESSTDRGGKPGQLGDDLPYVNLGSGLAAIALSAGGSHTCAILDDGTVKCWGNNFSGQLGLGDSASRGANVGEMGDNLPAVELGTGRTATALALGYAHSCALLDDNSVKCWGVNDNGELGLGDTITRGNGGVGGAMGDALPAVDLGTNRSAKAITAGDNFTCALLDDDSVKCWGGNGTGQLGQADTLSRGGTPAQMGDNLASIDLGTWFSTIATAQSVVAGKQHACAILTGGGMKCWGVNTYGQLGLEDTNHRGDQAFEMGIALPFVNLGTDLQPLAIFAGDDRSCAIVSNGHLKCWGLNDIDGQLGIGDVDDHGKFIGEMGDNLPEIHFW